MCSLGYYRPLAVENQASVYRSSLPLRSTEEALCRLWDLPSSNWLQDTGFGPHLAAHFSPRSRERTGCLSAVAVCRMRASIPLSKTGSSYLGVGVHRCKHTSGCIIAVADAHHQLGVLREETDTRKLCRYSPSPTRQSKPCAERRCFF